MTSSSVNTDPLSWKIHLYRWVRARWLETTVILIILVSVVAKAYFDVGFTIPCIIKALLGIRCPGCGLTTAAVALAHLDFLRQDTGKADARLLAELRTSPRKSALLFALGRRYEGKEELTKGLRCYRQALEELFGKRWP